MFEPEELMARIVDLEAQLKESEMAPPAAEQLIACLEGEIAKRDEELAACRVAVENCELFRNELCRLSGAQAIIDGLRGEVGAQRVKTCAALKARNDAREERDVALAECERLRMQLAACGVVALANTIESAGEARQMHPDYMSASCSDVADAVDREIALRTERDDLRQQLAEARDEISQHSNDLAIAYMKGGADMRQQRDKLADILRDLVPGCKWQFMRPRIDAALAEIDHGNE